MQENQRQERIERRREKWNEVLYKEGGIALDEKLTIERKTDNFVPYHILIRIRTNNLNSSTSEANEASETSVSISLSHDVREAFVLMIHLF